MRGAIRGAATGQVLRAVGLALEVVCLGAFLMLGDSGWTGIDARPALKLGVALGAAIWVAGWTLIWTSSRRAHDRT